MAERKRPIRVLLGKPGLDGHDQGVKVLALSLRDAGMEVIYTGLRQTPEEIVRAAIQEDVDVIGLSSLSGAHNHHFTRVTDILSGESREDILVIGGGIIPREDVPYLQKNGIKAVFGPGSSVKDIAGFIEEHVK
ncbi:MAG: cobalamin B12-binding domain-containing protein [Deltaproteobacteria bacterium]|nr:cobalamin B12-binding domain-containing protein [Deltaproteobacteria bacterium]